MNNFTKSEIYFAKRREEIFDEFLKYGLTQTLLRKLQCLATESVKSSQPFFEPLNIRETLTSIFGAGVFLCGCGGIAINAYISGSANALCDYRATECLMFKIIEKCAETGADTVITIGKEKMGISLNRQIYIDGEILRRSSGAIFTGCNKTEIIVRYKPAEQQICRKTDDIGYLSDPLSYAYIYLCDICRNPLINVKP